jgi:rhamnosyltransferase
MIPPELPPPTLVSIILLTKNGEQYLRSLLAGLLSQTLIDLAEVIVIDSGSSDKTLSIIGEFPAVQLFQIPEEEFGHGKTRNFGASIARGEFLVYVPQDATPIDCDWLEKLLLPFADSRVVGTFGRQIPRVDASAMERFFLLNTYHDKSLVKFLDDGDEVSLARCFFSTVSGAIRASVWADHPFREDIIMSEDQAWAKDVMLLGRGIAYESSARVLHSHQYTIGGVFRRNFDSGYSISQIFGGITGVTRSSVFSMLVKEAGFVFRRRKLGDMLKFLPYEVARHFGFWLGLRGDRLPIRVSSACSNLRYFWSRSTSADTR